MSELRAVTSGSKLCAARMGNEHVPLERTIGSHRGLERVLGNKSVGICVDHSGVAGLDVCAILLVCAHDAEGRRRNGGDVDLSLQCARCIKRPDVRNAPYVGSNEWERRSSMAPHPTRTAGPSQHWTSGVQGTGHRRQRMMAKPSTGLKSELDSPQEFPQLRQG